MGSQPAHSTARKRRSVKSLPRFRRKPSHRNADLQKIRDRLELVRSSVVVVARALQQQNCETDDDAARVLRHHVTDALTEQVAQIGLLIRGSAS